VDLNSLKLVGGIDDEQAVMLCASAVGFSTAIFGARCLIAVECSHGNVHIP
jgi:hypothetical protein